MPLTEKKSNPPVFSALPDEALMEHVVRGSEAAFAALVDRYRNRIINLVSRFISDRDRAQEIAQEVFLRIYVHRERYRPNGKFSTWMYTIAVNLAKNEIRRRVRSKGVVSLDKLIEVAGDSGKFVADPTQKPDRRLHQREVQEYVEEALKRLPEKFREVIVLRDIQQLSYEEIEEVLGIPGGTVRSRINRARTSLQEMLGDLVEGGIDEL
ncbi:MAG: sigma-70 family RNA polymerase sigma factor [Candidatus Eisenbacteria bacterium]|uniref:Sigma-70 family RNA polymerase sigma factor n=1 Tax=Eiseniibacteriota bacterium TaxID=2212470 RepID=A0A956SEA4_UNCEI|nr:sigma-70 family RNA polymerase sigma factor [Candidatus Eisenbacteria bacterium]MCB9462337.1 sigma-70 family RNA polymerase sigma factor [Candidatus Eisenbacteria bacterium]